MPSELINKLHDASQCTGYLCALPQGQASSMQQLGTSAMTAMPLVTQARGSRPPCSRAPPAARQQANSRRSVAEVSSAFTFRYVHRLVRCSALSVVHFSRLHVSQSPGLPFVFTHHRCARRRCTRQRLPLAAAPATWTWSVRRHRSSQVIYGITTATLPHLAPSGTPCMCACRDLELRSAIACSYIGEKRHDI